MTVQGKHPCSSLFQLIEVPCFLTHTLEMTPAGVDQGHILWRSFRGAVRSPVIEAIRLEHLPLGMILPAIPAFLSSCQ